MITKTLRGWSTFGVGIALTGWSWNEGLIFGFMLGIFMIAFGLVIGDPRNHPSE